MPSRRINTMGEINNHCTVANSTSRIVKLQSAMELAKSIDQVKKRSAALKEDKQQQAMSELTGSFVEAEAALDDKGDISQCKIQHIRSLCWGKWHELLNCKNKAEYVAAYQAIEQSRAAAAEQARQRVQ